MLKPVANPVLKTRILSSCPCPLGSITREAAQLAIYRWTSKFWLTSPSTSIG